MPGKRNYSDFTLLVNGTPGSYTVEARGPGQIAVPPAALLLAVTSDLQHELDSIASGIAPSRQRMQQVGELLFNALFTRRIIRAFGRSYDELPEGGQLRLKLVVRPPELNVLPWELLYDSDEAYFLAARLTYPLVRFIESTTPVAELLSAQPLRLLYVQSQPVDQTPLDLEASERNIRLALSALGSGVEIETVRQAKPADLRRMLRKDFHILHYDGHAFFDTASGASSLVLQDPEGLSHMLGGELFASYLDGSSIRLVVLAACQSGLDSSQKRFSGIAHQVMRSSSLPAVVAMQYDIDDASAAAFNGGFYAALADRYPVDAAVIEGRKAVLERLQGDPFASADWATPVLFLRTEDGEILSPSHLSEDQPSTSGPQVKLEGTTVHGSVITAGRDVTIDPSVHVQGSEERSITPDGPPIDGPATGLGSYTPRSELIRLVRQRLSEDRLEDALRYLAEIDDQAALPLQVQLKRLKNDFLLGTLTREEFTAGRSQVAEGILTSIR